MNIFNFSWGVSYENEFKEYLDQSIVARDWMDIYSPLNSLLRIINEKKEIIEIPHQSLFFEALLKAADQNMPQAVHGVVLDIIISYFKRYSQNQMKEYIQLFLPIILLMGKTALPQIRGRCIEIIDKFLLNNNDFTLSLLEPLVSCFASSLLQPVNGLQEKALILFQKLYDQYNLEFEQEMWLHLCITPHTREGLLKFINLKKYQINFNNIKEQTLCDGLCEMLLNQNTLVIKQTLDLMNEQLKLNKVNISSDCKRKLIQVVIKLVTFNDSGITQRLTQYLIGENDSQYFELHVKDIFIKSIYEILQRDFTDTGSSSECTKMFSAIIKNKLLSNVIGNTLTLPLMNLFIKINLNKQNVEQSNILIEMLKNAQIDELIKHLNSMEFNEKIVFVMYYIPSEEQKSQYITIALSLFKTLINDYFQKQLNATDISVLESALIIIKKTVSSLHDNLNIELPILDSLEPFKKQLTLIQTIFGEREVKALNNLLSVILTFATITTNEEFHYQLNQILLNSILSSSNIAPALVCCRLFFRLTKQSKIYLSSSQEVVSFLWKNVSSAEQFLPIIVSLLASNAEALPFSALQDVIDYERLLICMHMNKFYQKIINTNQMKCIIYSLLKSDERYFKVARDWFLFLMSHDATLFISIVMGVLNGKDEMIIENVDAVGSNEEPSSTIQNKEETKLITKNSTTQIKRELRFLTYFTQIINADIPGCFDLLLTTEINDEMKSLLVIYPFPRTLINTPIHIILMIIERICVVRESVKAADLLIILFTRYEHSEILHSFSQHILTAISVPIKSHSLQPIFHSKLLILTRTLVRSTPALIQTSLDTMDAIPLDVLIDPEIFTDFSLNSPKENLPILATKTLPEIFLKVPSMMKSNSDAFYSDVIRLIGIITQLVHRIFREYPVNKESSNNITFLAPMFNIQKKEDNQHFFKPLLFGLFSMVSELYQQLPRIQIKEVHDIIEDDLAFLMEEVFFVFPDSLLEHTATTQEHRKMFSSLFLKFTSNPINLYISTLCSLFKLGRIPADSLFDSISQILPMANGEELKELVPELFKFFSLSITTIQNHSITSFLRALRSLVSCSEINNLPPQIVVASPQIFQLFYLAVQKFTLPDDLNSFTSDLLPLAISLKPSEANPLQIFSANVSSSLSLLIPQLETILEQKNISMVEDVLLSLQRSGLLTGKWKNLVISTFNDKNFFVSNPSRLSKWLPIISLVYSQHLDQVWQSAKGSGNGIKERVDCIEAYELKKAAFVVLCGDCYTFDKIANELLKRILKIVALYPKSNQVLINSFLFLRVIYCKCSFVMTRLLLGQILVEAIRIIKNYKEFEPNVLLEILKFIDIVNINPLIDFEPFRWLFTLPLSGVTTTLSPFFNIIIPLHPENSIQTELTSITPIITLRKILSQEDEVELRRVLSKYNVLLLDMKRRNLQWKPEIINDFLMNDFIE
ncbi:hypothetical protein KM1_014740 [Entamoeba histolytica HM-3:IMSS]|uniref:DOP1 N-terminal domain-containing protein n=1 Tax=Entamoeba histolytica HM-3:IMSS TaxID=885315 RepID=M7WBX5_ENTHI|nr:hypothetical protein KM1_014740 [Entamoeba histolytica HM-3:IMSS]